MQWLGNGVINITGNPADGRSMLALLIRQPHAEKILRGVKRIEYRSRPTKVIGQRFYIYGTRKSETSFAWDGYHPHLDSHSP